MLGAAVAAASAAPRVTKTCRQCGLDREIEEFAAHKSTRDKLGSYCKACSVQRTRDWRAANPERNRRWRRARTLARYGLTPESFDNILREQDGRCAICRQETVRLVVDHDHQSGDIRGLLCDTCNRGLGHFRDNAALLARALEYLG